MPAVPDDLSLRPANDADRPLIAALHARSWKDAYRGILPDAYLQGPVDTELRQHWATVDLDGAGFVLVADAAGSVVGFVTVWLQPEPLIDNLHVAAGLRSRGLGAALLRAAAARLIALGEARVHLWVVAENRRAIAFYERLGAVAGPCADDPMGGIQVPCLRMDWQDLQVLLR